MRRDYKVEDNYIDWLKSIGCTLYSPFQGDLGNKIDGQTWYVSDGISTLTATDDCAMLVSPREQSVNERCAAMINTVIRPHMSVGQAVNSAPITIIGTVKCSNNTSITNQGSYSAFPFDGGTSVSNGTISNINNQPLYSLTAPSVHATANAYNGVMPTSFMWFGGILDSSANRQIYYKNGQLLWSVGNNRTFALTEIARNHAGMKVQKCSTSVTYYVKDCYVFTSALISDDMLKIYQHDQQ